MDSTVNLVIPPLKGFTLLQNLIALIEAAVAPT